jgi:hypothetical protein
MERGRWIAKRKILRTFVWISSKNSASVLYTTVYRKKGNAVRNTGGLACTWWIKQGFFSTKASATSWVRRYSASAQAPIWGRDGLWLRTLVHLSGESGSLLCICHSAYRKGYLERSVNNFDLIEIHLDVKNSRIQSDWKDICREKKEMKTLDTLEMTTSPVT